MYYSSRGAHQKGIGSTIKHQEPTAYMILCLLGVAAAAALPPLYIPDTDFQTFDIDSSTNELPKEEIYKKANEHLAKFSLKPNEAGQLLTSHFDSLTGLYHFQFLKSIDGVAVVNSPMSLTIQSNGNVIRSSSSFVKASDYPKHQKEIACTDALQSIANHFNFTEFDGKKLQVLTEENRLVVLGFPRSTAPVTCNSSLYFDGNNLTPIWNVILTPYQHHFNVFVDKSTAEIVAGKSWSVRLSRLEQDMKLFKRNTQGDERSVYRVIPLKLRDLLHGGQKVVPRPFDPIASPKGWHSVGSSAMKVTAGNNVYATEDSRNFKSINQILRNGILISSSDYKYMDSVKDPKSRNIKASINQAFYLANVFHDIMYRYGFDEGAGNFQSINYSNNGRSGDPVVVVVQAADGMNNANFLSPPDGQAGILRLYLFDTGRDGAMDNSIILHELSHGVTNRLTGGPMNNNCVSSGEAAGLSEGWSDIFAIILEMTPEDQRSTLKVIGGYAIGRGDRGVRQFPYSTDMKKNPLTYRRVDLSQAKEAPHTYGSIWGSMLFEIYWNLVDKHGFDSQFEKNPQNNKGNNIMLKLLLNSLKMQPCNPTFESAKQAFIFADQALYGGANKCEIWKGFAKRGLGYQSQAGVYRDDFTLPPGCS
jgi:extracellular elastinolytic metalloproteinase